jgi:hypothetical protein
MSSAWLEVIYPAIVVAAIVFIGALAFVITPYRLKSAKSGQSRKERWDSAHQAVIAVCTFCGVVIAAGGILSARIPAESTRPTSTPSAHVTPPANSSAPGTSQPAAAPAASFRVPENHSGIGFCYTASGTSANIPAGKVLWLVLLVPTTANTKPTPENPDGGQPYVIEAMHPSSSGTWKSHRYQLGDPGETGRPFWLDLYLADPGIQIPGPDTGAQFSLLREARFLSEIAVHRLPPLPGAKDGSC